MGGGFFVVSVFRGSVFRGHVGVDNSLLVYCSLEEVKEVREVTGFLSLFFCLCSLFFIVFRFSLLSLLL